MNQININRTLFTNLGFHYFSIHVFTAIADCSAISVSTVNMSTVNETAMTTGYESIMVPPAAVKEKLNNSLEELDALNVSDCDGNQFLDGCKVSWVLVWKHLQFICFKKILNFSA